MNGDGGDPKKGFGIGDSVQRKALFPTKAKEIRTNGLERIWLMSSFSFCLSLSLLKASTNDKGKTVSLSGKTYFFPFLTPGLPS